MDIYISSYGVNKLVTGLKLQDNIVLNKSFEFECPAFPSYIKKYGENLYIALKKENDASILGILECKISQDNIRYKKLYESEFSFTHLYIDSEYILGASYHQGAIQIFKKDTSFSIIQKYKNSKIHNVGYIDRIKKYYAVDLANDCIYFFKIENNAIVEQEVVFLNKNDSPRHIWYQSMNRYIYVVNENSSTVTVLDIEKNFQIVQKIPTKYINKENKPAAIMGDMKNEFLYVSNRGCDNIVCYAIKENGLLEYKYSIENICNSPRDFFIKNDIMYITNTGNNSLVILQIESSQNHYKALENYTIEKPVCIEM